MSHFNQIKQGRIAAKARRVRSIWMSVVCAAMAVFLALGPAASAATTGLYTKTSRNPSYVLKADLSAITGQDTAVLDWRMPRYTLRFDLPAHDWYDNLDLFLSAVPQGGVNPDAPLLVSYNGGKSIPLYAEGSRFDAHIRLDPARIRTARNEITISYQDTAKLSPREGLTGRCVQETDGQWILKLSSSKLSAAARAKPRSLQIREIETRLAHPMTAPKRVAIIAKGQNKIAYEALAAQGIGLRMDEIPEFSFSSGLAPFEILIGTRSEISGLVNSKKLLGESGSRVFVDTAKRARIVLTADTEAALLDLSRAFAAYQMPSARRAVISEYEFYSSRKLSAPALLTEGKQSLNALGSAVFQHSWNPQPAQIKFNAQGAANDSATLALHINADPQMQASSRLSADLNGRSIGYTYLDRKKKLVTFQIPQGLLQPASNTLTLKPDLQPGAHQTECLARHIPPALQITERSSIKLHSGGTAGLAQFAAAGQRGSASPKTVIITAKSSRDRAAALRVLAFAAQQVGPVFAEASYADMLANQSGDLLIIGPNAFDNPALLAAAPKAVQLALRGEPVSDPNGRAFAADKFASLDAAQTLRLAAASANARKIGAGGIAAMFVSPYNASQTVTVISATNPNAFASSAAALAKPSHWNAMRGGVMRWNKSQIVMAQAASALPTRPSPPKTGSFADTFSRFKANLAALLPGTNPPRPAPETAPIPLAPAPAAVKEQPARAKPMPLASAPSAPLTLRGASVLPAASAQQHTQGGTYAAPRASSGPAVNMPRLSMPKMNLPKLEGGPTIQAMRTEFTKAKHAVQQSYREVMSGQFFRQIGNVFEANRMLSLILAAFAGLILIGFAVPKPAR